MDFIGKEKFSHLLHNTMNKYAFVVRFWKLHFSESFFSRQPPALTSTGDVTCPVT